MIGKGKFFDLISRTADDVNNAETTISGVMDNFNIRLEKYFKQINKSNDTITM